MKRHNRIWLFLLLGALVLGLSACGSGKEGFSCFVLDERGGQIQGFQSETDGIWYLYLPGNQSIRDAVLYYHYDTAMTEASSGTLKPLLETVEGGFGESGDILTLTGADGASIRVAVLQSELPSVQIFLARSTLDMIHRDQDVKYKYNTLVLTDPAGTYSMTVENRVTIKGRGNSTWDLHEKKGYQLEFSVASSLLGMPEGKKWILLANAFDDSLLRNQLVYEAAAGMDMAFVPEYRFVDLWIDNVYQGTYLIGEKVELAENRLALADDRAVLMEHDEGFYMQEEHWFFSNSLKRHFSLKDAARKAPEDRKQGMDTFGSALDALMAYLYRTPSSQVTLEELSRLLDVDSAAKYFLLNEFSLNREAFVSSFYWYQNGPEDVLHLGPVWDFDTCMGNDACAFTEYYGDNHTLFRYLLAAPAFYRRTQELLNEYSCLLEAMPRRAEELAGEISGSARMNYLRWNDLGQPNGKYPVYTNAASYGEAVDALRTWLEGRLEVFSLPDLQVVTGYVDENLVMAVSLEDRADREAVRFAVWSESGGNGDLQWYEGTRDPDGVWRCDVDLKAHAPLGFCWVHAYSDDAMVAWGCNYVLAEDERWYTLKTTANEAGTGVTVTLEDSGLCGEVLVAFWSDAGGQDDLVWYPARRNDRGDWEVPVDLSEHPGGSTWHVHAYEDVPGKDRFLQAAIFAIGHP